MTSKNPQKLTKKAPKKQASKKSSKGKQAKKKSSLKSWLTGIFFLGFVMIAVAAWLLWQAVMTPIALTEKDRVVTVKKGQTYYKLIDDWHAKGLIKHAPLAKLYSKFFISKSLHTGAYQLYQGDNLAQVLTSLSDGGKAKMVRVQIIEGKRSQDLLNVLANTEGVVKEISHLPAEEVLDTLNIEEPHLEGVFAPNTYFFGQQTSDIDILEHLYKTQKDVLALEWQGRDKNLPYKTPYEALIMASIIEKETSVPSERALVAAVFVNRLRKGMKLQTDPTVIYGMGERYDGNIRKKDLREKTAYNTYQIHGLPPTPIALPSEAAIQAALHPAESDALFFVATGTGGHTFTKTYAQHKKAVKQYLKVMREKNN